MFHQTIKSLFSSAVSSIVSQISQYTVNPGKDDHTDKHPVSAEHFQNYVVDICMYMYYIVYIHKC